MARKMRRQRRRRGRRRGDGRAHERRGAGGRDQTTASRPVKKLPSEPAAPGQPVPDADPAAADLENAGEVQPDREQSQATAATKAGDWN